MKTKILNKEISILLIIFILFSFFILFLPVYAQGRDVAVEILPENPGPNEEVLLKIVSYATDLNRSDVFWYLNNKLISSGTGKTTFSFVSKSISQQSIVEIIIDTPNLGRIKKKITITPSEVDLLWESDGYTPPFYKGKALPSSEGTIKVVAFPNLTTHNGTKLKSGNLIYQWKKNYKILGSRSGYGKRVMIFNAGYIFNIENIKIKVSSKGGSLNSNNSININIGEPKILFYEKNPLLGIKYEKAISKEFSLGKKEVVLVAEPYFFSPKDKKSDQLVYNWSLNDEKINNTEQNKNEITLRQEGGAGSSRLSIEIENITKILQSVKKTIIINFNQQPDFTF